MRTGNPSAGPAEHLEQVARQRRRSSGSPRGPGRAARRRPGRGGRSRAGPRARPCAASRRAPRSGRCPGSRARGRSRAAERGRTSAGSMRLERGLDSSTLLVVRVGVLDAEQAPPDLAPDEVARVRAERLALPERDEQRRAAGRPGRTRRRGATCPCRPRRRSRRSGPRPRAAASSPSSSVASSVRRPTSSQLVADPAPGGALERAGQLVRHDRASSCP